jgi:hypothetical protein
MHPESPAVDNGADYDPGNEESNGYGLPEASLQACHELTGDSVYPALDQTSILPSLSHPCNLRLACIELLYFLTLQQLY